MATVWAPRRDDRIGRWRDRAYSTGWSHTVPFNSLTDLAESLRMRPGVGVGVARKGTLPGPVSRLGIVAHGDRAGLVQLDRHLTSSLISSFRAEFTRLAGFLTPDAKLIFYSCLAGAGAPGTNLLSAISGLLPGRTIVGFTVLGETQSSELVSGISAQSPGYVREAPFGVNSSRKGRQGFLTPWNDLYAKWARDGRVVRRPTYDPVVPP